MNCYSPFESFPENGMDRLPLDQETLLAAAAALQFELGKSYNADATCTADTVCASDIKGPDSIESVFHASTPSGVRCFSTLAEELVPQTLRGAERCKTFYLDRLLLQISNHVIGCSRSSEIFRGVLNGKPVAVKQLRVELVEDIDRKKSLKTFHENSALCACKTLS